MKMEKVKRCVDVMMKKRRYRADVVCRIRAHPRLVPHESLLPYMEYLLQYPI